MKSKIIIFLILFSSLFGYLEWGGNNHMFLFQAEAEVLSKLFKEPIAVLHPLTLVPILGQLILVYTLFQKSPNKIATFVGIGFIGLLLGIMVIVGLLSKNFKILFFTLPFFIFSFLAIRNFNRSN